MAEQSAEHFCTSTLANEINSTPAPIAQLAIKPDELLAVLVAVDQASRRQRPPSWREYLELLDDQLDSWLTVAVGL
jgi:hypothetical protein